MTRREDMPRAVKVAKISADQDREIEMALEAHSDENGELRDERMWDVWEKCEKDIASNNQVTALARRFAIIGMRAVILASERRRGEKVDA